MSEDYFNLNQNKENMLQRKIEDLEVMIFGLENKFMELEEMTESVLNSLLKKIAFENDSKKITEILQMRKSLIYRLKEIEKYISGDKNE